MVLCILCIKYNMSVSFLILLICFLLVSLVKGFSVLSVLSKNQLLVSLIFSIVFLVSQSFISTLIFVIREDPLEERAWQSTPILLPGKCHG